MYGVYNGKGNLTSPRGRDVSSISWRRPHSHNAKIRGKCVSQFFMCIVDDKKMCARTKSSNREKNTHQLQQHCTKKKKADNFSKTFNEVFKIVAGSNPGGKVAGL